MEYKSAFELRQQALGFSSPLTSKIRAGKKNSSGLLSSSSFVVDASNNAAVADAEQEDPTALVRELPALDKLNALSASMKNEEEVQNYVEARNLSLEDTARYIMAHGSTGQKMSLFQRLKETLAGVDMSSISQLLMIVVDSMWVQEPELQCFAPGALLEVLPLLNNGVARELFLVTSTMLSVKTAEVRIAWNKLFPAFIDYLNIKQLDNDVVPLALKKTEYAEPQDQRELSCELIGGVCRHLPRDIVEQKLMHKVLALCQDTNVGVRRSMCQQLGIVARALGAEMAKQKVAQELFELLNDEDQTVSRAAFSCLVDLVEFFGPAYRREHLYPIIKSFISHPPEEVVSLIVGEFGRFLWEIKADIQTSEDVTLFAGFYQNAALKGDDSTRYRCAYNLPSVTASLSISVFPVYLAPCCEALATDQSESVRRSIAAGLHELVPLLGDKAALYLRKPFLRLLSDPKKSVLNALSAHSQILLECFVHQLNPADRNEFFSSTEDILLQLVARAERDWRIMDHVLKMLSVFHGEFQETTLYEKMLPLVLKYGRNGAFCLKDRSAEVCIKIVASLSNVNSKVQFFSKLNNEYAHSSSCILRKDYLRFVRAACSLFSRRFIRERMLECCFELQHDQMDMVRLELARLLPSLRKVLEVLPSGSVLDEYQDMVYRLQMDESADVRAVTHTGLEIMELRDRELKRGGGKIKFEEENREDRRREQVEGQLLDVAKEYDKAERRSKLRDLLKTEREKEQAEAVRNCGVGRRPVKNTALNTAPTHPGRPMPKMQLPSLGGAAYHRRAQR
ncbi:serine/threonine-protein phosphatase 4 regulatory subunit 4 [Trypanosoma rangeli]|uniref:Serine/threonine-protein phosphatase 4 regulatory subunit 4 n=1 Tax=Trypanosoma rangeli TaxID=5698 RepID=A0A3S5ISP0_TRYRA|nr:serine/threonine-protein phosphatase 4 regulatory subunit 4 [Trypanosoma rangeli]RNF12471.1 serine/threonine-protein phosphatase 4 regulatory subunit 4 [Trypanosoma rangeli]|eukprot:RNF12471.1 serine/threonine-protein phosphatase 4 regulatory subunit 4 [Trypanosoma rangeli]